MAAKLNHGDGFNDDGALEPIHFMTIILPETLSQGKQRIPQKFVRKYGKHLSNPVFLILPNGAKWKVNVEKRDNGVWLHKGWKEFVEYHSLAHGHLLVFRYDGTSHFHVFICGRNAMEINYPLNKVDGERANNGELQPSKTRRAIGNKKDKSSNSIIQDCKGKGKLKNPSEEKKNIGQRTKRSTSIGNCNEAAGNSSFKVIIKSRHLKKYLNLPKGSLQGYIKPGGQNAKLLAGDKSWQINMIYYPKNSFTFLSAGWLKFARENNLEVGDACLFKLQKSSDEVEMKVSVSKCCSIKS